MDIAPSPPIESFYKYSPILSREESHRYFGRIASFKKNMSFEGDGVISIFTVSNAVTPW